MPQNINPNARGYTKLTFAREDDPHPHVMLGTETLHAGKSIILCLHGVEGPIEIAGHVELDRDGWYLDTNEVAVMLHAGLWARLPR